MSQAMSPTAGIVGQAGSGSSGSGSGGHQQGPKESNLEGLGRFMFLLYKYSIRALLKTNSKKGLNYRVEFGMV